MRSGFRGATARWWMCGLLFAATTILYVHRQVLSILKPDLEKVFGWTQTDYANMVFAYQLAYAIGVLGAGWMADRIGTRRGFSLCMAAWSLVAALHGAAASVWGFIAARFALGVSQGGSFPCAIKATGEWFPRSERAYATSLFNTGSMVGPILAPLAIVRLYTAFGWRTTCVVLGALGWIWVAAWAAFHARAPAGAELGLDEAPAGPERAMAWGRVLRYRATWAFFFGKLLSDPIWWFFLFWLPSFLHDRHGVSIAGLGAPLVTIYSITIVGSVGAGWLTRRLIARGRSVTFSRKSVMLLCALMPVPVLLAARTGNVWLAVVLIGLATAGHSGWMANLFSVVSDVLPRSAVASVTGIGTMAGALGGMFIARFAGWILDTTGSYTPLFWMAAFAYLVAWTLVHLLTPRLDPGDAP